jgi:hypothetical protein
MGMVRRLNTHKFIPREREPLRVLTVAAIILPLGHALMAQPWEHESPGALLASCRLGLGTTEEVFSMCDYSLHNVKSRPAKVGDKLTTRNFNTGTRGFAAPEVASTAVCVLPGTGCLAVQ